MTRNKLNAMSDVDEMISILKVAGWSVEYRPDKQAYPWRANHPNGDDYEMGANLFDVLGDAWECYVASVTGR